MQKQSSRRIVVPKALRRQTGKSNQPARSRTFNRVQVSIDEPQPKQQPGNAYSGYMPDVVAIINENTRLRVENAHLKAENAMLSMRAGSNA